jgi:hypothetical protein
MTKYSDIIINKHTINFEEKEKSPTVTKQKDRWRYMKKLIAAPRNSSKIL